MGQLKTIVFVGSAAAYRQFLLDEQDRDEDLAIRGGYACSSTARYVRYTGDARLRGMTGPAELVTSTEPDLNPFKVQQAQRHVEIMNQTVQSVSPHGPGGYRSSACIHAVEPGREHLHRECQTNALRWDGSRKQAAQCKYGGGREPCSCSCHDGQQDAPERQPRFEFYVEGRPAPQGSKIAGQGGSMREQSPYLRKWRADVKRACFVWYRDNGIAPDALPWFPAGTAVELVVTFYVATDPTDPPDWDKLGRSTGDALTEGRAWADDGQVTDGHVRIRRADEHHPAGAFITIREATL